MIYLDNCATTPIDERVYEAMIPYLTVEYGNPSSKYYTLATKAKDAIEESRNWVAKLINAEKDEIVFTSGATESTNMIIKGVADYKKYYEGKGNHIITSKAEHHATLNTCKFLNGEIYSNHDATFSFGGHEKKVNRGYEVTFLDVNSYGQVEEQVFADAIKPNTILASFIWGNNEIASLNDIGGLTEIAHKNGIGLHADATQVLGKIDVDVKKTQIDFMSCSAHKLSGPKGVGVAYIKSDDFGRPPLTSLIHGGEQEEGIRAGTLSVHNIVGFGKAAEIAISRINNGIDSIIEKDKEIIRMLTEIPFVELLGDPINRIPGIYSIIINKQDFNNERFLKKISAEFALSTGSACALGEPSHVLKVIGKEELTSRVVRISTCDLKDVIKIIATISQI